MDGVHAAETDQPNLRRFVLLDRDGTINVEKNYLGDPHELELLPGAAAGMRYLRLMGLGLVVVTNQSGVARGYFDEAAVSAVHIRLRQLLLAEGVDVDAIYVCPDAADSASPRRKPAPGMVHEAARDFGFDPKRAFVIGDKAADVELGRNVGARSILVRTGYGRRTESEGRCVPDFVADDLRDAAEWIHRSLSDPERRAATA